MKIDTFLKTLTAGMVQLTSSSARVRHISIQAATANAGVSYVGGPSSTTGHAQQVVAGVAFVASDSRETVDPSQFYVAGTADDIVRVFTISGG